MNVGQMLSKHLIAAVLLIIVIALGTGIYFITKEKPEAEPLSLIDKVRGIANSYGSGVGYEIHSWTDNEAWASIYLEAENEPIPFENFYFQMTDNDWSMKSRKAWLVPSPSRALSIIDYTIRTTIVSSPPEFSEIPCLKYFIPVVKNLSRWPAFVAFVGLKLENSTNRYEKSYPTMGRLIDGIVSPWETTSILSAAPGSQIYWYEDENLPPPTKLLRMDHLDGKTFEITITLKDGAETVLAENTFTHTF